MSDEKGKLCFIQLKDTTGITVMEGTTEDTEDMAATKEDSEDTEASATDGEEATSTTR